MFDLIVRNANLPDGREKQDILVKDGKIADIVPSKGNIRRRRKSMRPTGS